MSSLCPCGAPATHRWEGQGFCLGCKRDILREWFRLRGAGLVHQALLDCGVRNPTVVTVVSGPSTPIARAAVARGGAA